MPDDACCAEEGLSGELLQAGRCEWEQYPRDCDRLGLGLGLGLARDCDRCSIHENRSFKYSIALSNTASLFQIQHRSFKYSIALLIPPESSTHEVHIESCCVICVAIPTLTLIVTYYYSINNEIVLLTCICRGKPCSW